MTECVLIPLDWPDSALIPHAKGHWRTKAKATRAARKAAGLLAIAGGVKNVPGPHDLHFTYYPPDRRRRDIANVHAALKAAIDGIADALDVDDNTFRPYFPAEFEEPIKGGGVLVEVRARG